MANPKNKIIYAGETLIDLTGDTVTIDTLLKGAIAHDASGAIITGTCEYDMNTQAATAAAADILIGKTAGVRGSIVTGTMPNNEAVIGTISTLDQKYTIPLGKHDGSGYVQIDPVEQAKGVPANIRQGVTFLGIEGTMSGTEDVTAQAKTVTPTAAQQVVLPDEGYNYLSQVTVAGIPYTETENAAGGITVTIG